MPCLSPVFRCTVIPALWLVRRRDLRTALAGLAVLRKDHIMPRVYRQQYTRPIPEGAERVTVKVKKGGKEKEIPAVRFKDAGGKYVVAPLTAGGDRCRVTRRICCR